MPVVIQAQYTRERKEQLFAVTLRAVNLWI